MKLGPDVLLEIVHLVQKGILEGKDISGELRQLDLIDMHDESEEKTLVLSKEYKEKNGRV